jgi:hypothetical protein
MSKPDPQTTDLTADFVRTLPGGALDDATYSDIETALDLVDAPCTGSGRWLTLPERIKALAAELGRVSR